MLFKINNINNNKNNNKIRRVKLNEPTFLVIYIFLYLKATKDRKPIYSKI